MWQDESSPDQPSGEPRSEGQLSLSQAPPPPPPHGREYPQSRACGAGMGCPLPQDLCTHIQSTLWLRRVFFPLWKASMRVLGDLSPCLPVESQV